MNSNAVKSKEFIIVHFINNKLTYLRQNTLSQTCINDMKSQTSLNATKVKYYCTVNSFLNYSSCKNITKRVK